jgi:hypothetical protein
MRLKSFPGLWLGAALLLSAAMPRIAEAGITYSGFQFSDPIFATNGTADVKISGSVGGEGGTYSLSAEFCQTGFCTGDSVQTDTVRLTNLNISCTSGGTCDPIDISFQVSGSTDDPATLLEMYLDSGSFTGTPPTGFSRLCVSDGSNVCSSTGVGAQSSTFTFGSGLVGTTEFTYQPNGPFNIIGDFHLDGLTNGSSVSLGSSLSVTVSAIPEPAAILLFASGLGGLVLLRRAQHRRPS